MSSAAAAAVLRAWCAARPEAPLPAPVLVVAAHPDDEVVGAGGRLACARPVAIVHVTDGAPRDGRDACAAGCATRAEYRALRRRELDAALALAGVGPGPRYTLGIVDQGAAFALAGLTWRLAALIARLRPLALVTHAYEGGHPDHDATAFAARHACAWLARRGLAVPLLEMTGYFDDAGRFGHGRFAGDAGDAVAVTLGPEARALKRRMLDCFASQQRTLAPFGTDVEWFRIAPRYDFLRPPPAGGRYYERFSWGLTGVKWEQLARAAQRRLTAAARSGR